MKCPKPGCGEDVTGRFCKKCGTKITTDKHVVTISQNETICSGKLDDGYICGAIVTIGENFCDHCGNQIENTSHDTFSCKKCIGDNVCTCGKVQPTDVSPNGDSTSENIDGGTSPNDEQQTTGLQPQGQSTEGRISDNPQNGNTKYVDNDRETSPNDQQQTTYLTPQGKSSTDRITDDHPNSDSTCANNDGGTSSNDQQQTSGLQPQGQSVIDMISGPGNNTDITSRAEETMNSSDFEREDDNSEEPETIQELTEIVGKFKDELKKNGMVGLTSAITRAIINWKSIHIHIGVIGGSGSGKSSFINAIRGIDHADPAAAEVDIQETTQTVRPYPHPKRKNLVFWDVPGVGTETFPRKTYLKAIDFEKYDFYILVSASRFKNTDKWLVNKIQSSNKKFYFLRTKIDVDIANVKAQGKNENEKIKNLREHCTNILKDAGVINPLVFFVNNNRPSRFDFSKLVDQLLKDAPDLKKEAFVLAMSVMSKSVLEEKRKVLKKRIYKVAILSALGAALPIPGPEIAIDVHILIKETNFYKKQFGTDENTLKDIAKIMRTSYELLVSEYEIKSSIIIKSVDAFVSFADSIGWEIGFSGLS